MEIQFYEPVPEGLILFETMRQEAGGKIRLWPLHLARLRRGCRAVGFPLDEARVEQVALAQRPDAGTLRIRLTVDASGRIEATDAPLPANPPKWTVTFSDVRLNSADPWLGIKSSNRAIYDRARGALPKGTDEAILLNERGEVCEGSITSLFLRVDGMLLTPHLSCGLLPGVLRQSLLDTGQSREATLLPGDLDSGQLFMGNALRGLIPVRFN